MDREGRRCPLPLFVELLKRQLWLNKVEEAMAAQKSERVHRILDIYRATAPVFDRVIGGQHPESLDIDQLERDAEAWARKLSDLGYSDSA